MRCQHTSMLAETSYYVDRVRTRSGLGSATGYLQQDKLATRADAMHIFLDGPKWSFSL